MTSLWTIFSCLFILGAVCCTLYYISDPLERLGGRIGLLLGLPEDVIASTFQAIATSGPEIVMAIISATAFIAGSSWSSLQLAERACSGTLNMAFSAMDNLLGIGAIAIVYMIHKGKVDKNDVIPSKPSTIIGLAFYILISGSFSEFTLDGILTVHESSTLAGIAVLFIFCQLLTGILIGKDEDNKEEIPDLFKHPLLWATEFFKSGFVYAFLVFALIVFVKEAMGATFTLATLGITSLGGVLLLLTSYVSSFPEFMLAFRYVQNDKKHALLGMLFGSNVIDLGFAGFRSIWLQEPMKIYTTGIMPGLLKYYIMALPLVAILILIGLMSKTFKWKHAYPLVVFYVMYIVSGFILL